MYALLAVEESAPVSAIEEAYLELKEALQPHLFRPGLARSQAEKAMHAVEHAYGVLTKPEQQKLYKQQRTEQQQAQGGMIRPRLGMLCVASGMITMEQLKEAVNAQLKVGLPLGEILQDMQVISQAQLDGLLLGQQMIDAPATVTDAVGARLVALGLVSEDMVLIAQMEQRAQGRTVDELLVRHGWVDREVLKAIKGEQN